MTSHLKGQAAKVVCFLVLGAGLPYAGKSFADPLLLSKTVGLEQTQCGPSCEFGVSSVHPSAPGTSQSVSLLANGIDMKAVRLRDLISIAYGLKMRDLVSGLPGWADSDRFDIQARVDDSYIEKYEQLRDADKMLRLQAMLQTLLVHRFGLKAHYADKEMPVYELQVANTGKGLLPSRPGEAMNLMVGEGRITAVATSMGDLVTSLGGMVGRIVLDKTGLHGTYDFTLATEQDGQQEVDEAASLFSSLKDQLGLKLVPSKAFVSVLVVEHVDKPAAN